MKKITSFFFAILLIGSLPGFVPAAETDAEKDVAKTKAADAEDITEGASPDVDVPLEAGLLRIGISDPVRTMDVQKTTEEYMIPLNIYERLFDIQVDEDGSSRVVNGLAEDYSVSDDGLTYRFTLRENAFFQDGTPVNASDVAYTFTRMLSEEESVQTDFADMILGAEDVMTGKADVPKGIQILNDKQLEITLSEPFAGYIHLLAAPSCSILSESFTTRAGDSYGTSAEMTFGSGPYMVTEYSQNSVTLEKNPYYQCHEDETLSVSKAVFLVLPPALMDQTFQEDGIDLLDTNLINPDAVKKYYSSAEWSDALVTRSRVEIQYMMLNMDAGILKDSQIRKAVQMAINRQEILDKLYDGKGSLTDGIFPEGLIGYCEENQGWLEYNPEGAKKLIDQVPEAKELHLELAANSQSNTRRLTMLKMIQQDLSAVGLNAQIVSYDSDSFMYLRTSGRLMAYTGEWSADFNDPDNFIYTFFGNRGKTLYRSSNFADEEVFARITGARAIQEEEKRLEEYADLERLLIRDEAVWVPLFSSEHLFVLGERVEDFVPFWAGWSSMYLRDVTLKEGR